LVFLRRCKQSTSYTAVFSFPGTLVVPEFPLKSKRSREVFQDFCEDLLGQLPEHANVRQFGVSGDDQGGFDLFDDLKDRPNDPVFRVGYECKLESTFGASKVQEVHDRAGQTTVQRRIILLGRPAMAAASRKADDLGWEIWDSRRLSALVRGLMPWRAERLVRTWFGPNTVETFLGFRRERAFVLAETYFAQQLDPARLLNHERRMIGRSGQLDALHSFRRGGHRIALIVGRRFIGKSRLLREFAKEAAEGEIVFRQRGSIINEEALHELPAIPLTIIIDALTSTDELDRLFSYASARQDVKLIIAIDGPQRSYVVAAITAHGFESPSVAPDVALSALSHAEKLDLIHLVAPHLPRAMRETLALATSDTPLSTIAAATIAGATGAQRAERSTLVIDTLTSLNRDLLDGRVHPDIPPTLAREILSHRCVTSSASPND